MSRVFEAAKATAKVNGSSVTIEESKQGLIKTKHAQAAELHQMKLASHHRAQRSAARADEKFSWELAKRTLRLTQEISEISKVKDLAQKAEFVTELVTEFGSAAVQEGTTILLESRKEANEILATWESLGL